MKNSLNRRKGILRVFPSRTTHTPIDDMVFIGDPPLDRPGANEVHVSCTFTWEKPKAERLKLAWGQYYQKVKLGGPAYDDPGGVFSPGLYLKQGITTTSRGCNHNCPWCLVNPREGPIRILPIKEGRILQDNNILQCPGTHIDAVFDMLTHQSQIELTGGLEAARVTQSIANKIRGLKIKQIFLACDTNGAIKSLRKAIKLLQLPREKVRCYVLLKYEPNETILQALIRLLQVWEAGAKPFAQLYQPPDKKIEYPVEWSRFVRTWQRPAGTAAFIKSILETNKNGRY